MRLWHTPPIVHRWSTCTISSTHVKQRHQRVTFTITTSAPVIAGALPAYGLRPLIYSLCLSLPGLVVLWGGLRRSRRKRFVLLLLLPLIVVGLWLEIACGGGLQGMAAEMDRRARPQEPTTMTVIATVSSLPQQTAQAQVTVN